MTALTYGTAAFATFGVLTAALLRWRAGRATAALVAATALALLASAATAGAWTLGARMHWSGDGPALLLVRLGLAVSGLLAVVFWGTAAVAVVARSATPRPAGRPAAAATPDDPDRPAVDPHRRRDRARSLVAGGLALGLLALLAYATGGPAARHGAAMDAAARCRVEAAGVLRDRFDLAQYQLLQARPNGVDHDIVASAVVLERASHRADSAAAARRVRLACRVPGGPGLPWVWLADPSEPVAWPAVADARWRCAVGSADDPVAGACRR